MLSIRMWMPWKWIDVFNMVAGLKKITIREEKPEKLPVCTDIDMLKTIIRNLLSNAIKFSNENSEVLVKMEEQGDTVVVSVKDSGCGIDEEGQKKLLHTDTHFSTFGTNNEEGSGFSAHIDSQRRCVYTCGSTSSGYS